MNEKTELQRVGEATMRFMRGKYVFDEVGDGKDELEFRENDVRGPQGVGETFISIRIREDRYDFHINGGGGNCEQKKCMVKKGVPNCRECGDYDDCNPEVGYSAGIEPRSILFDDVTWAILPYVHKQYGN